jgi:putative Mg2+ transporter-C (MgtC) family protein
MPQEDLLRFVASHGFSIANLSYHYCADEGFFEYRAIIRTRKPQDVKTLSDALSQNRTVREFSIRPTGD